MIIISFLFSIFMNSIVSIEFIVVPVLAFHFYFSNHLVSSVPLH